MIIATGKHVYALVRSFDARFNPWWKKEDERIILISTKKRMLFLEGAKLAIAEKDPSVQYIIHYYDNQTGACTGHGEIVNKCKSDYMRGFGRHD